jgi:hypothetical protein
VVLVVAAVVVLLLLFVDGFEPADRALLVHVLC